MALESKYHDLIVGSSKAAAAAALPGTFIPLVDLGAVGGIWANMLVKLAKMSGNPMGLGYATKVVTAAAAGFSGYYAGCKLFTYAIMLIPGLGWLGAMGINAFLNYIFTYKLGKICKSLFEKPGFDAGDATDLGKMVILPLLSFPSIWELREMV